MNDANTDQIRIQRVRRRVYGRDFKLQVVRRMAQGLCATELVQDFGISPIMAARWVREWRKDPAHAFRGYGQRKPFQEQLDRLRRKNKKLMAERDFLKKASARFALIPNWRSDSLQSIERSGRSDGCVRFSMSHRADTTVG